MAKYDILRHITKVKEGRYYYYDENLNICYRQIYEGTLDYYVIFSYIHTCNLVAIALVVFAYAVVVRTVVKMRGKQSIQRSKSRDQIHRRAEQKEKQNKKIALMAVLTTTCVAAPWFLSMMASLLILFVGYQQISDHLGPKNSTSILRTNQYLYYIVTWMFPIVSIKANSALSRATTDMINNIQSFELSSIANSMARFNIIQHNSQSNSQSTL